MTGIPDLLTALMDHAQTLGRFDRVNGHEPKNAPGSGLSLAFFLVGIRPAPSGLAATSVWVTWGARVYVPFLREPQDGIDPALLAAVTDLMTEYSTDFTLGGLLREIDLLGASGGDPLSARAGYIEQDKTMYRVADVTIPMLVNDAFTQGP
jgi:hypothetical protein